MINIKILLTPLLVFSLFPAVLFAQGADFELILRETVKQQEKLENGIKDMTYKAESSFIQKSNSGKIEKQITSTRTVYQKIPDKTYQKYIGMKVDAKVLSQEELDKEMAKQKDQGSRKKEAKSPFSPSMKDSYEFKLLGEKQHKGQGVWIVGFIPREKNGKFIEGKAYISQNGFHIVQMEFVPAKLPAGVKTMAMTMAFSPVRGYWLPVKFEMTLNVKIAFILTFADKFMKIDDEYSDYRINTGLDDSLFKD